ncbi:hypothetical protein [Cognatishimia activa]|uniref:Uncharacterized protein n=1 Tax=Cognatishimia activa TaxID=1715691 RepID=A0A975I7J5_9RHOB|nr:hypothetical protein [Cognatishimia activa]QTN35980.1 hypothetical protein HZ995_00145 [Cognatishimia activa]
MSYKWKRRGVFLAFLFLSFAVPIWIMSRCSGWNEGSMQVAACSPDWIWLAEMANSLYAFVLVASFMGGIPILIYLVIVLILSWILARVIIRKPTP